MSSPGPSAATRVRRAPGPLLFGPLALLLVAGLIGWLGLTLPNFASLGGDFRHWMFLASLLPGVIPGVGWVDSHLGQAVAQLGQVDNLPQRLPLVFVGGLILLAAQAYGRFALRLLRLNHVFDGWERMALGHVLGATILSLATLLLGRLGLINRPAAWILIAIGLLIALEQGAWRRIRASRAQIAGHAPPPRPRPLADLRDAIRVWGPIAALVSLAFVALMLLGSMQPTVEFDAVEYHLQAPKEWFRSGRVEFLPHNIYANMPAGVEMLTLLGMAALGDWWRGALVGQFLIASFAPATALLLAMTLRRAGAPIAAGLAALVWLTTPWVYRLAVIPFVEGPLCAYHAALVLVALAIFSRHQNLAEPQNDSSAPPSPHATHLWVLAGLLAGAAMSCKYPGLVSAVLPFGLLAAVDAFRQRRPALVLVYGLGVGLVAGPWLLKNLVDTGNPVYPLAYDLFGGSNWSAQQHAKWSRVHGPQPATLAALGSALLDVAARSDWHSPLYLLFAPFAFARPGTRRLALALAAFIAYLFATWFLLTHRLDRFWLPLLPAAALLAALGADWTEARPWRLLRRLLILIAVATNFAFITTPLAGPNEWTVDLTPRERAAFREADPALGRLQAALPPSARVLVVGQAGLFHLNASYLYNTVFDHDRLESLARDRTPAQILDALTSQGITHIYIDWSELDRYRSPGNYGYTDFITRDLLDRLRDAGVLGPANRIGPKQDLYEVTPGAEPRTPSTSPSS